MRSLSVPLNSLLGSGSQSAKEREKIRNIYNFYHVLTSYNLHLPILAAANITVTMGWVSFCNKHFPTVFRRRNVLYTNHRLEKVQPDKNRRDVVKFFLVKEFRKMVQGRRFTLCTGQKLPSAIFLLGKGGSIPTANGLWR